MRLPGIARWLTARRLLRTLDRIAVALERQSVLLAQLADHYAPLPPADPDQDDLRRRGSVDTADDTELLLAQAFADRYRQHTGQDPTDDEILFHLADEQTQALHTRLNARRRR